jgi:hypothetical protein
MLTYQFRFLTGGYALGKSLYLFLVDSYECCNKEHRQEQWHGRPNAVGFVKIQLRAG